MTNGFLCPICGKILTENNGSLRCSENHCFDKSKSGYVNLLKTSGKKGHGDDKIMVKARHDFLKKGCYEHLKNSLCEEIGSRTEKGFSLLDSGCGEGYYTAGFYDAFSHNGGADMYGVDVSKEALKIAAKSCKEVKFAAASAYALPFENNAFDIVVSLFAPLAHEEFYRVMKKGGYFITAVPMENHLYALKKAIYDTPYRNKLQSTDLKGFSLAARKELKKTILLSCNEDIKNLFMMTPYYYKTSAENQKRLDELDDLEVETEFLILVYAKL